MGTRRRGIGTTLVRGESDVPAAIRATSEVAPDLVADPDAHFADLAT